MSDRTYREFYTANQGFLKSIPDAANELLELHPEQLTVVTLVDGDYVITQREESAANYHGRAWDVSNTSVDVGIESETWAMEVNANKIAVADQMSVLLVGRMLLYVQEPPSIKNGFRSQPNNREIGLVTPREATYTSLICDDNRSLAIDRVSFTGSKTYTHAEQYIFTYTHDDLQSRISTTSANGRVLEVDVKIEPESAIESRLCVVHFPGFENISGAILSGYYETSEELDALLAELSKGYVRGTTETEYGLSDILDILKTYGESAKKSRELCHQIGAITPDLTVLRGLRNILMS